MWIDAERIEKRLDEFAEIGFEGGDGWRRLAFSREEQQALNLHRRRLEGLGAQIVVDPLGGVHGIFPGLDPALDAICVLSHLDTVRRGGKYDGTTGVVFGQLIAEELIRNRIRLRHTLVISAFPAEEADRWDGAATIGSLAVTGRLKLADLEAIRDKTSGRSAADLARDVGLHPEAIDDWQHPRIAAALEAHIFQRDDLPTPVAAVTHIANSTRYDVRVTGRADHSGSAPMAGRANAGNAACEMSLEIERLAIETGDPYLRATGTEMSWNSGKTTVPHEACFSIDIRHIDGDAKHAFSDRVEAALAAIAMRRSTGIELTKRKDGRPAALDPMIVALALEQATALGIDAVKTISGAGHDVANFQPAGLVFIRSRNGSHNPRESADPADLEKGANVTLQMVRELDRRLSEPRPV